LTGAAVCSPAGGSFALLSLRGVFAVAAIAAGAFAVGEPVDEGGGALVVIAGGAAAWDVVDCSAGGGAGSAGGAEASGTVTGAIGAGEPGLR
jgi:hypothetical protein